MTVYAKLNRVSRRLSEKSWDFGIWSRPPHTGQMSTPSTFRFLYAASASSATRTSSSAKTNNQLFSLATNDKKALMPLGGFSDSNHAPACDPEFRSTSGYTMFVLFCLVSWKSKLQSITAQSTHEAELIALTLAANEAVWIRDLLITLGFTLIGHTVVRPKGSEKCIELDARKPPEGTSPADDMVEEFVSSCSVAALLQ